MHKVWHVVQSIIKSLIVFHLILGSTSKNIHPCLSIIYLTFINLNLNKIKNESFLILKYIQSFLGKHHLLQPRSTMKSISDLLKNHLRKYILWTGYVLLWRHMLSLPFKYNILWGSQLFFCLNKKQYLMILKDIFLCPSTYNVTLRSDNPRHWQLLISDFQLNSQCSISWFPFIFVLKVFLLLFLNLILVDELNIEVTWKDKLWYCSKISKASVMYSWWEHEQRHRILEFVS